MKFILSYKNGEFILSYKNDKKTIRPLSICLSDQKASFWNDKHFIQSTKRIIDWLEQLEINQSKSPQSRVAFRSIFQDTQIETGTFLDFDGWEAKDENDPSYSINQKTIPIVTAFYKAIYTYLEDSNRFHYWGAQLCLLFCVWQWLSLIKYYVQIENADNMIDIQNEFAEAYRSFKNISNNIEFYDAVVRLGSNVFKYVDRNSSLYIEDFRYSILLEIKRNNDNLDNVSNFIFSFPSQKITPSINILNAHIHPFFKSTVGKNEIRRIISEFALKRYDFKTTLQIAFLVDHKEFRKQWIGEHIHCLLVFLIFIFFVFQTSLITTLNIIFSNDPTWSRYLAIFIGWVLMISAGYYATNYIDYHIVPYLVMPRMFGGIFLGYTVTLFQLDINGLSNALFDKCWIPLIFLYLVVVSAGFLYLVYDTLPFCSQDIAKRRAFFTMVIGMVMSLIVGLFVLPFHNVNMPMKSSDQSWFLGLAGWVNIKELISLTPLALFTGLVTQFLFEEKTISASVWAASKD